MVEGCSSPSAISGILNSRFISAKLATVLIHQYHKVEREPHPTYVELLLPQRPSLVSSSNCEICGLEENYMPMKSNLPNFPIVQGHRAHRLNLVIGDG